MSILKTYFCLLFCTLPLAWAAAQNGLLDSLEQAYSATTEPEQRLELLAQMTDIAFTKDLQLTMALKNFEALLPAEWFQRTHRSYLVNLRHIEEVVESELIIGDKRLPLGSNWREALMQRLLN